MGFKYLYVLEGIFIVDLHTMLSIESAKRKYCDSLIQTNILKSKSSFITSKQRL